MRTVHVRWNAFRGTPDYIRGRLWIQESMGELTIAPLYLTEHPPAGVLPHILRELELEKRCVEAHLKRGYPYTVLCRVGMSGCQTYTLRYEKNCAKQDYPFGGSLHVSMLGKVGELRLPLMDLPPLLRAAGLWREYDDPHYGVEVVEQPVLEFRFLEFRFPFTESPESWL